MILIFGIVIQCLEVYSDDPMNSLLAYRLVWQIEGNKEQETVPDIDNCLVVKKQIDPFFLLWELEFTYGGSQVPGFLKLHVLSYYTIFLMTKDEIQIHTPKSKTHCIQTKSQFNLFHKHIRDFLFSQDMRKSNIF